MMKNATGYADLAVYGADGSLQLLVKVKTKTAASAAWVTHAVRHGFAGGELPAVPYFMLALPDKLYLWKGASQAAVWAVEQPDFVFETTVLLRPLRTDITTWHAPFSGQGLEILLAAWFDTVTDPRNPLLGQYPPYLKLQESGLLDAIRNGTVEVQDFAQS